MKNIFSIKRILAFGPVSKELFDVMANGLGHDVATVYSSILGLGDNKEARLRGAATEKILIRHQEFLENLIKSGKKLDGLQEVYDLVKRTLADMQSSVPETVEKALATPMHPSVKDIKAKRG